MMLHRHWEGAEAPNLTKTEDVTPRPAAPETSAQQAPRRTGRPKKEDAK